MFTFSYVYWASLCMSVCAHTSACTYILSTQQLFSLIWMFKGQDFWPLKMEPVGCPETSVRNYCYSLSNNPEEQSSHLLCGRSLKSHMYMYVPLSSPSLWEFLLFTLKIILEFYRQLSLYDELLSSILSFYYQCETQYELHLCLVFNNSLGLHCIKYSLFAYTWDITFYLPALFI
jgi:hypothetical protein